jgi:hypothetical protein
VVVIFANHFAIFTPIPKSSGGFLISPFTNHLWRGRVVVIFANHFAIFTPITMISQVVKSTSTM